MLFTNIDLIDDVSFFTYKITSCAELLHLSRMFSQHNTGDDGYHFPDSKICLCVHVFVQQLCICCLGDDMKIWVF